MGRFFYRTLFEVNCTRDVSRLLRAILGMNRVGLGYVTLLSGTGARACKAPRPASIALAIRGKPFVMMAKRSLGSLRLLLRRAGKGKVGVCARNRVLPTRTCPLLGGFPRLGKGFKAT